MNLENDFRVLNDIDVTWKVCLGSTETEGGDVVYAARVELEEGCYGALARDPVEALHNAVMLAEAGPQDDVEDEVLERGAEVLKATLDELGFDRAVALLERLSDM